jgi:hypothetical protein
VRATSAYNTYKLGGKKGENYLYHRLPKKRANKLICVGCSAHNMHNTVQSAFGCLPVDTHPPTGKKNYKHSYIYAIHVEAFKSVNLQEQNIRLS